jgi:uncharacterized membrane protein YcaP (DUF421 family)
MEADNRLLPALAPVVLLGLLQWVTSALTSKSPGVERVVRGQPVTLVSQGQVNTQALAQEHMSQADLKMELRQQGFPQPQDVDQAVLEPTGKLSVFPAAHMAPLAQKDIQAIARAVVAELREAGALDHGARARSS